MPVPLSSYIYFKSAKLLLTQTPSIVRSMSPSFFKSDSTRESDGLATPMTCAIHCTLSIFFWCFRYSTTLSLSDFVANWFSRWLRRKQRSEMMPMKFVIIVLMRCKFSRKMFLSMRNTVHAVPAMTFTGNWFLSAYMNAGASSRGASMVSMTTTLPSGFVIVVKIVPSTSIVTSPHVSPLCAIYESLSYRLVLCGVSVRNASISALVQLANNADAF